MSVIGSIMAKLELDITNFSSNLSKVQSEIESTGKKLDGLSNLGSGITDVGSKLTKSLTVPIAAVGTAAVTTAANFESAMSGVEAISGATGDELKALETKALELGASTKYTASEVADAMTEMAKAGWTSTQIIEGMEGVLNATSASGENLASVSTIVADAITSFGLEASDATLVADLLTQSANAGTIGINDLGESFKYIAPVAASCGFNIIDVTTAITAMSKSGIKGSQAGTSLRTMLTNLIKPTDDMAAAMDELGIEVANEDGTMKSLDEILTTMRSSFSGLTDEQKTYYAAVLAGKTGMSGLLSLMNLTQEEYDEIAASMENAEGVAKDTADTMLNNLPGQLTILKSSLESLLISLGDLLLPILEKTIEKVQQVVTYLNGLSDEEKEQIIKIAEIVAAIGPCLIIIGKLVTTFTTLSKVVTGIKSVATSVKNIGEAFTLAKAGFTGFSSQVSVLGTALAGISAPMLAIVAVVAILVAAFVSLWNNNEEFRNKITEIWTGIVEKFKNFFQGITDRLNALGFDFENFGEVLKAIWQGICDFLAPIFIGAFQLISDTLGTILDVILGIVDFFISIFTGDWEGAWNAIKGIFESIWEGIKDCFSTILDTLKGIADAVLGWFGTSWSECWTGIKDFFSNIWNGIVTWFQGMLNGIATFFTNIWNGVSTFFQTIWNGIVSFFTNIITKIVTFVQTYFGDMLENIKNIFGGIKEFIVNIWEAIKNFFLGIILAICDLITGDFETLKSDMQNIWDNIKSAFQNIWEAIKTIFTNALQAVKNCFSGAMNAIKKVASTVWDAIKTFFSNTLNSIKTTFTNIWSSIKSWFSTTVTNMKTSAVNTFNNMKTAISTTVSKIKMAIVKGFKSAVSYITSLPSQALQWGKDIIENIVEGIKSMIGKVKDAASDVASSIRSFLHFSVPDEGPLTDFKTYMPDMIDGFVETLKKSAPNLYRAAETVASGLSSIFSDDSLREAMAGAYGSVSGGTTSDQNLNRATDGLRNTSGGRTINIEKIEVRDDDDIEELTQGIYNHNDKSLRAMGRRNL